MAALLRTATAFWEGALKTGRGGISTPQSLVFAEFANNAKANCVVSKALSVPITLDAALR